MSQVSDVINKVSQDIRLQLSATGAPGQAILIDYTNRIHKQVLRFSRWDFILSEPQYFITSKGQTDYYLGSGSTPAGFVNTGLALTDVDRIKKDDVWDLSNMRQLKSLEKPPVAPSLIYRSGQSRPGLPKVYWHNHNDPFNFHIYPAADNENVYTPYPSTPVLTAGAGGALAQRTYFVRLTLVDSLGGESAGSDIPGQMTINANNLITVGSPDLPFTKTSTGVTYSSYNVYAAVTEGSETKQNVSPIAIGTNWTEPTSGLTTTGSGVPTASTIAPIQGYIIKFRYYKDRITLSALSDPLQVPDDYEDIIVQGVQYLAFKLLNKKEEAQASQEAYKGGLTEMIWDKNLFPDNDFVRPDPATYVAAQTLGWGTEFF